MLEKMRHDIRNEGRLSGKLDAIYKVNAANERVVWLKDQAVIETYHDGISLSFGCLTDVTKEMEQKEFLEKIGYFDELTNLPKRRIMDRLFDINIAQMKRGHLKDFTFLMIDIDHFKQFNDRFGHKAGDYVLAKIAELMTSSMRREERLGRYGGEEFYGVSLGPLEAGVNFAERLRALVEKNSFSYNGRVLPPVTISIGIAAMSEVGNFSESELVELADRRLYAAKRGGRNRVVWQ
jgi:diguanylate cyclase (GGDEF)-like protein